MKNEITTTTVNFLGLVKYFQVLFISVNAPEESHQTLQKTQQLDPALSEVIYLNMDWIRTGQISQWTQNWST